MPQAFEPAGDAGGPGGGGQAADGQERGDEERGDEERGGKGGGQGGGNARPCPICGKPSQQATRPFCSKRCRNVDLNRWLSGSYVVLGAESEDEGSE